MDGFCMRMEGMLGDADRIKVVASADTGVIVREAIDV
jgi:hypothetical protein